MKVTLEHIKVAFAHRLPGFEAQLRLASDFRIKELCAPRPAVVRTAGVLLLIYPHDGGLHFPLIRRASNAHDRHSGQISFPGGSRELHESIQDTALRETEEEIGVARDKIHLVGTLSPIYIPPSNFLVTPSVAKIDHRPNFECDPKEVAALLEVPLSGLIDPTSFRCENWERQGMKAEVPFYQIGSLKVWGATAMILSEFCMLLERGQMRETR